MSQARDQAKDVAKGIVEDLGAKFKLGEWKDDVAQNAIKQIVNVETTNLALSSAGEFSCSFLLRRNQCFSRHFHHAIIPS